MKHDNDIIIGADFDPMIVAHALTSAYVECPLTDVQKAAAYMVGCDPAKSRLVDRFTLDELEEIARHIMVYVERKRKEEQ